MDAKQEHDTQSLGTDSNNMQTKKVVGCDYFDSPETLLRFPPIEYRSKVDIFLVNALIVQEYRSSRVAALQKRYKTLLYGARRHLAATESFVKKEKDEKAKANAYFHGLVMNAVDRYWSAVQAQIAAAQETQIQDQKKKELHAKQVASLEYTEKILKDRVKFQLGEGKIPKLKLLENIGRGLRVYQKIGVEWLMSLHDQKINGILADEMGLGKTIQTIAFLTYLAEHRGDWGSHLVVVPMSILLNWENEFSRWAPSFNVLSYYGTAKERAEKRKGWDKNIHYNVVIVSYNTLLKDKRVFRRRRWSYLVLDEAHAIKSWETQRWQVLLDFRTEHRLLLSGTPLQNNAMELWSLLHFLMPDSIVFESYEDFKALYGNPVVSLDIVHRLHQTLRPFLLRRLKCDVEKQLPKKIEKIILCPLSKRQRTLYDEYMGLEETRKILASRDTLSILGVLIALRKVCNHPNLFQPRTTESPFVLQSAIAPAFKSAFPELLSIQKAQSPAEHWNTCGNLRHDPIGIMSIRAVQDNTVPFPAESAQREERYAPDFLLPYVQRIEAHYAAERDDRCRTSISRNKRYLHQITAWPTLAHVEVRKKAPFPAQLLLHKFQRHESSVFQKTVWKCLALDEREAKLPLHDRSLETPLRAAAQFSIEKRVAHPSKDMLQYDSGKLQTLAVLLPKLRTEGHKCLIFTQFTKVLNILEEFLTGKSMPYFRLDGSTHVRKRQHDVDEFNTNDRIFAFILSTRSGGLGLNLVGADTVIFYDSDWNPAIDVQAQDRCHRIGQQRDVTIYRLVSEHTVEEKILLRAREKKKMNNIIMRAGNFQSLDADSVPPTADNAWKDSVLDFFHEFDEDFTGSAANNSRASQFESCLQRVEDEEDAIIRGQEHDAAAAEDDTLLHFGIAMRKALTEPPVEDSMQEVAIDSDDSMSHTFYIALGAHTAMHNLHARCLRIGRVVRVAPIEAGPPQAHTFLVKFEHRVRVSALQNDLVASGLVLSLSDVMVQVPGDALPEARDLSLGASAVLQEALDPAPEEESDTKPLLSEQATAPQIEIHAGSAMVQAPADVQAESQASALTASIAEEAFEHYRKHCILQEAFEPEPKGESHSQPLLPEQATATLIESHVGVALSVEAPQEEVSRPMESENIETSVPIANGEPPEHEVCEIADLPCAAQAESTDRQGDPEQTTDKFTTKENPNSNQSAPEAPLVTQKASIPSYPNRHNSDQFTYIIEPSESVTRPYVLAWLRRKGISTKVHYHEWRQSWLPRTIRIAFASSAAAQQMRSMHVLNDARRKSCQIYSLESFERYERRMRDDAKRVHIQTHTRDTHKHTQSDAKRDPTQTQTRDLHKRARDAAKRDAREKAVSQSKRTYDSIKRSEYKRSSSPRASPREKRRRNKPLTTQRHKKHGSESPRSRRHEKQSEFPKVRRHEKRTAPSRTHRHEKQRSESPRSRRHEKRSAHGRSERADKRYRRR